MATSNFSAASSNQSSNRLEIGQTAHGFIVGNLLHHDGTQYVFSQANAQVFQYVAGMVTEVTSPDSFILSSGGYITGLSSLNPGSRYYLSRTVPGGMTPVIPYLPSYLNLVFVADTASSGYLNAGAGEIAKDTNAFDTVVINNAELRLVEGSLAYSVTTLCKSTYGDDGEGYWLWFPSITTADDDDSIIKPTATVGAGRWMRRGIRRLEYNALNVTVGSALSTASNALATANTALSNAATAQGTADFASAKAMRFYDFSGARFGGVTYSNGTSKWKLVIVGGGNVTAASFSAFVTLLNGANNGGTDDCIFMAIPPGGTYSVTNTPTFWIELSDGSVL